MGFAGVAEALRLTVRSIPRWAPGHCHSHLHLPEVRSGARRPRARESAAPRAKRNEWWLDWQTRGRGRGRWESPCAPESAGSRDRKFVEISLEASSAR